MIIHNTELNAYCSGHNSNFGTGSPIVAFPQNFVIEAAALSGGLVKIAGDFTAVKYLLDDPATLRDLPALDEQPLIKEVLEHIECAPNDKIRLLKANAPYSVLAPLVEPAQFYRWLVKNPADVYAGLERITAGLFGYISKAFAKGVRILSLADPYANGEILGENHYRAFAGHWLVKLLKTLRASSSLNLGRDSQRPVIHLCPHSSLTLEHCGLLKSETLPAAGGPEPYIDRLAGYAGPEDIPLLGHQCIYSEDSLTVVSCALTGAPFPSNPTEQTESWPPVYPG